MGSFKHQVETISENVDARHQLWTNLPEPFNIYRRILDGDHTHFGFWPDDMPELDLKNAQERMIDLLLSFFPDPPAGVLVVESGLGCFASLLAQKGYRVTAIDRSAALTAYARHTYGDGGIDFQVGGFLDHTDSGFTGKKYDIILFLESLHHHYPLDAAVHRARTLLGEKGKIIIGGEVCLNRLIQPDTGVHHRQDILAALAENGFRIACRQEIQSRVTQTCYRIIEKITACVDTVHAPGDTDSSEDRLALFLNHWKNHLSWYVQGILGYEIIIGRKDDMFLQTYQKEDENLILPLFRKVFNNPRTIDHWVWKFRENPYGRHYIAEAFSENGELAAHFAGYPVPFYSQDTHSDFTSLQGGDTMTNPAYRGSGRGPSSVLSRIANYFYDKFCDGFFPFIYGFNTGTIRKFGERFLQYEYLDPVPYHVRETKTIGAGVFEKISQYLRGVKVREVHAVDPVFDQFFQKVSTHYGLLVKRDRKYLQWRYMNCPERVHRLFAVSRWGRMTGWGVFSLQAETLIWGDALCDPGCLQDMNVLLNHAVETFLAEFPVNRIAAWFSPVPEWWHVGLRDLGFSITEEPNRMAPCFKFFSREFSIDDLRKKFYYTMGDSDLF
jgi:2-polyprenyl-3-methyl-5-hydroxy-6-metoxy-1,4-benzoquinol methylase